MELTTANFLTGMRGPAFLQLYALVIFAVIAFCWWRIRATDATRHLEPPLVPAHPDPYELACLRGGPNEMARLMALSLIERGYIEMDESSLKIRRNPRSREGQGPLTAAEARIVEWCGDGRAAKEMFREGGPADLLRQEGERYQRRFEEDQLVVDAESASLRKLTALGGATAIFLFGLARLLTALAVGRRNIGFLIAMMVVGTGVAALLGWTPRLSSRGTRYLKRLRMAFPDVTAKTPRHAEAGSATTAMMLGAGLFGLGVLAGGPHERYRQMFSRSSADVTATIGCGSSDSGSSGCGSGGGCGGGGCGGCGS